MGDSYTDDFFRAVYHSELEEKHKLDSADSLLVGVVLALSGVGIYYLRILPAAFNCGWAGHFFLGFGVLFSAFFIFAFGFLIASLWPRDRAYIGSPKTWNKFVGELRVYYARYHDEGEVNRRVGNDLATALQQKHVEAAETNWNYNIKRMAYQTRVKQMSMLAGLVVLLNSLPTYVVQCARIETQKTEIVAFPEVQKIKVVSPEPKGETNERRQETHRTTGSSTETGPTEARTSEERARKEQRHKGTAD